MAIDGQTLKQAIVSARIEWFSLALKIGRPRQVVADWLNDREPIPPYMLLTVKAIGKKLDWVDNDTMHATDLVAVLGIEPGHATYWKATNGYPQAARYAVAAMLYNEASEQPLTENDYRNLSVINASGRYWRIRGGWRARPVLGRLNRTMRADTPSRLIMLGLARTGYDGRGKYLELTPVGQDKLYKRPKRSKARKWGRTP